MKFDLNDKGELAFTKEAAHTRNRILHADALGEASVQLLEQLLEVFDRYRVETHEELAVLLVGQRVSRERMVELALDGLDATEDATRTTIQIAQRAFLNAQL